jgi:hypothetical protein
VLAGEDELRLGELEGGAVLRSDLEAAAAEPMGSGIALAERFEQLLGLSLELLERRLLGERAEAEGAGHAKPPFCGGPVTAWGAEKWFGMQV